MPPIHLPPIEGSGSGPQLIRDAGDSPKGRLAVSFSTGRYMTDEAPARDPAAEVLELRRQLAEVKQATTAAEEARGHSEARVAALRRESAAYRREVADAHAVSIDRAIEGADVRIAKLKDDLAQAYAMGDVSALTNLQVELSATTQRRIQMEQGRDQMRAQLQQAAQQPQQRLRHSDPVEALASGLSPRSAAWVRAHPEAARDQAKLSAVAQHAQHVKGLEPDSDAWFSEIERQLGYRQRSEASAGGYAALRRRQASVGSGEANIALTAEQKAAARTAGVSEAAYAAQLAQLQSEGRL